MNWQIDATRPLDETELEVLRWIDDDDAEPNTAHVKAATAAARAIAEALGGEVSVTINGHETLTGDGFRAAHVMLTVSRLDPDRPKDEAS